MKTTMSAGIVSGASKNLRPSLSGLIANIAMAALIFLGCLMFSFKAQAEEETWEYSVRVSAAVQASPPQIILSWPQDEALMPSSYTVYRKEIDDTSWGPGTALSGSTTNYVDTDVVDGAAYEYQIVKVTSQYKGYGYIYAGMDVPLTESRGKLVLVVDNTYSTNLSNQLAQLEQDLVGDGWTVLRHDVSPTDPVTYVKSLIQADYNSDPANVNTVFLFGHVPVPYSGDIAPDEHVPAHQGAWPADVYYADMVGTWTDDSVNDTNAQDPRNWNVPGDGKFDQSTLPAPVQLMVGRVDLHNLPGIATYDGPPTFPDEETLLSNYLTKDHNYRQKNFDLPRQGLIGNYFGDFYGEAFAASGWRNFAPFFGVQNITDLPNEGTWLPTLSSQGYLWSYGCGPGSDTSAGGLGNDDIYYTMRTPDLYNADPQSVFVMLFGSWFGDWDCQDDLMRAVLATPTYGLACLWSGSPHWFCHHMALGETIGYSTRLTQNNGSNGLYQTEVTQFAGLVHVALMGDPTLRMHVVAPASNLAGAVNGGTVQLTWNSSPDSVLGYNVYRASSNAGPFTRLNGQLITANSFTDYSPGSGTQSYMVRAVKLEASASGTYYNASEGIFVNMNAGIVATPPVLNVSVTSNASRLGLVPGEFTFTRSGSDSADLTAYFSLGGTAAWGTDYELYPYEYFYTVVIPAGESSTTMTVNPQSSSVWVGPETIELTLMPPSDDSYTLGPENDVTMSLGGNGVSNVSLRLSNSIATLTWPGAAGRVYHVAYESYLDDDWTDFGMNVQGTSPTVQWSDPGTPLAPQRFYRVFETQ